MLYAADDRHDGSSSWISASVSGESRGSISSSAARAEIAGDWNLVVVTGPAE
ncbi:MAG: hypothetical protein JOZ92_09505 [Candidatus Dormibacteraeota bacterium]|nr:hypothetical protein [Candidatus Dormibacteraeota bacterium]